jgi:hypothetical protein
MEPKHNFSRKFSHEIREKKLSENPQLLSFKILALKSLKFQTKWLLKSLSRNHESRELKLQLF